MLVNPSLCTPTAKNMKPKQNTRTKNGHMEGPEPEIVFVVRACVRWLQEFNMSAIDRPKNPTKAIMASQPEVTIDLPNK
jgi:hypothetical protein